MLRSIESVNNTQDRSDLNLIHEYFLKKRASMHRLSDFLHLCSILCMSTNNYTFVMKSNVKKVSKHKR